jgi:hypothetical protein
LEDVRNQAAEAYTGEALQGNAVQAPVGATASLAGPSYHFEGTTPFPGFTIYNPVMDSPGNDSTNVEKPKYDWKKDWRVYAGGAAAVTAGGIFFSPLLFLGGLLAGIGLVLLVIEKKFGSIPS